MVTYGEIICWNNKDKIEHNDLKIFFIKGSKEQMGFVFIRNREITNIKIKKYFKNCLTKTVVYLSWQSQL